MKRFKIFLIPLTINKCIRFPNNLIKEIEDIIEDKDCTFTVFII